MPPSPKQPASRRGRIGARNEGAYVDTENGLPLHSPFGTELRFGNGSSIERVGELTRYLRPRVVDARDNPYSVTIMVLL